MLQYPISIETVYLRLLSSFPLADSLEKITNKVFFDIEIENGEGGRVVLGLFGDSTLFC